jgi:cell division transport system permease protein
MNLISIKRFIKSGLLNFFRNIWISIAATSMVAITLFIISTIIILYTLTVLSIDNSTDKVGVVTAYFNDQTTEREMLNVKAELETLPEIKSVDYTSKEAAREKFRQTHENEPTLIESLNEFSDADNPVPASLAIKTTNLTDYSYIYSVLKSERYTPYFKTIRDSQKVIDKLYRIIDFIKKFGVLLAGIFVVVTIMVTFNTIRLTIYNRRDEVEIMRLVGGTNWYIRGPFIVEGVLYALFATILTSLVVLGLLLLLSNKIEQFLSISTLGRSLIEALFLKILLVNFLSSVILSIIASTIAIRKYLRI